MKKALASPTGILFRYSEVLLFLNRNGGGGLVVSLSYILCIGSFLQAMRVIMETYIG